MNDFVVTRGAILKRNADKDFVAVSYTAPKKKQKSSEVNPTTDTLARINSKRVFALPDQSMELRVRDAKKEQDVQMKRARFDVIKFGMSGFNGAKGKEAKINLAVKLGAKPPKNKVKNYKEMKIEKDKEKARALKKEQISEVGKNLAKRSFDKKRRRKQPGLLSEYGVVTKKTKAAITDNKRRS